MPQFEFVGGAYEAANKNQDDQALVNWYVETDRNPDAKTPIGLLGCPGLVEAVTSSYSGEVRGMHVLPGSQAAVVVVGGSVLLMTITTPATATTDPVFSLVKVGTMVLTIGQVCIRDNGVAGICVIVDGSQAYAYNIKTNSFGVIADDAIEAPDRVASIDGWLIFNKSGTQKFYTSPNYWNGSASFDATYFALKDDGPDNLVTLMEDKRQLWLIGEQTSEIWFNSGGATFPFSRLQGATLQIGCAAKNSIARTGSGLVWLGASERGENFVVQTQGYDYKVLSNPALSYALTQYKVISDAFGYVYTEEGHQFYVLTFPTANATWVYDFTTEYWHQRKSYDVATGTLNRARANCLMNIGGMRIVGDYQNGKIWKQSRQVYSDGGAPLVALRRCAHVWDKSDRNRVSHFRLQVEFAAGVGLSTGQGSDPQMMVRWRDEKGWSNERMVPIGKIGDTRNRAIVRKLAASRDRVYEVTFSDPVKRDVVGASLEAVGSVA